MKNIAEVDKNFEVKTLNKRDNVKFINALHKPFRIYGLIYENRMFRRMPEAVAKTVSDGVYRLHSNTAGGRLRFTTDSRYIAISATMSATSKFPHCALTATIGFDMYVDGVYTKTFVPPFDISTGYEAEFEFPDKNLREITINFPLYSNVEQLYIGLDDNCMLGEPTLYNNDTPVVYYGSSITQGGCASRPGTCYESILSRRFNCDYINLGFSGNAKAEDEMIDYIKSMKMKLFVYDYDHNAPNPEHLMATHEKLFLEVRKAQPDLPIIMMPRPKILLGEQEKKRREIVRATYQKAIAAGDKNVYYIDGADLMHLCGVEGTVDNTHPNDFGFASMAMTIGDLIEKYKLL